MNKSFKDMTGEEREEARKRMLSVPVTGEEVIKFDPMIHKIIKNEVLRYWGNGANIYSDDAVIGRLGMSFSDLMQYGRLLVCHQIRWFKLHGIDPKTGQPRNAKMTTLIFQHLRNKFMSLSKSFASDKNGGQVVNVEENRVVLQGFYDKFDELQSVRANAAALRASITECSKDLQSRCDRIFKSNKEMQKFLHGLLCGMDSVSHVSYEDIESFAITNVGLNPESSLLLQEEIDTRLQKYCDKNNLSNIDLNDFIQRKKSVAPKFLPKDKTTVLMCLARERGIQSQRQLAEQLGIGMTTLSNIIRGRSRGTKEFRDNLESLFGKTFNELMEVVDVL